MADAWKLAKDISDLRWNDAKYIFGDGIRNARDVMDMYTPQETAQKLQERENKRIKREAEVLGKTEQHGIVANADRIRSMTDEEMAEFISSLNDVCLAGIGEVDCSKSRNCDDCEKVTLKWLQSPVEV